MREGPQGLYYGERGPQPRGNRTMAGTRLVSEAGPYDVSAAKFGCSVEPESPPH